MELADSKAKKIKKNKIKTIVLYLLPIVALVVLFGIYLILLDVNNYNFEINLTSLLNKSIILIFAATGATFIFSLGQFDISLGANVCFSAIISLLVYNATGSVMLLFLIAIITAVVVSALNAIVANIFHLPMFVTTIVMLSLLGAISQFLIRSLGVPSGTSFNIPVKTDLAPALKSLDNVTFKIVLLAVYILLMVFLFNFTKLGRKIKFIGGNANCAKLSGIKYTVFGLIAFAIAGIGVGLGSATTVIYTRSVETTTASSIGMSIFIAIVFGGMPISGGPKSRIYSSLIGGLSYNLMSSILFILFQNMGGVRDGLVQIISAALFLVIVFVASLNYRSKQLQR